MFFERTIKTDTALLKLVYKTSEYGVLDDSTYNAIVKILPKSYEANKTLVLHYVDTLYSFSAFKKHKKPYYYRSSNKATILIEHTPEVFLKHRLAFEKAREKCNKKAKALNIQHFYYYKTNFTDTYNYQSVNWLKADKLIINRFFKHNSGVVIIKPNGYYYKYTEVPINYVEAVLKFKNWDLLIENYEKDVVELPRRPSKKIEFKPYKYPKFSQINTPLNANKKEIIDVYNQNLLRLPIYPFCYSANY